MFDAIISHNFKNLLLYRNTIGVCVLILCRATLLNSLTDSNVVFLNYIVSSTNTTIICELCQFYFFLSNHQTFVPFSGFNPLPRNTTKMLNWKSSNEHSCLFLNSKGNFQWLIIISEVYGRFFGCLQIIFLLFTIAGNFYS